MSESKACICEICKEEFTSKTKLFKHLINHGFEATDKRGIKIVLLIGWLSSVLEDQNGWVNDKVDSSLNETSIAVETAVFRAVHAFENNLQSVDEIPSTGLDLERPKGFSRGAGYLQRTSLLFDAEPTCHGQSDTFCFYVKSLGPNGPDGLVAKLNTYLPNSVRIFKCYILTGSAATEFHAESECTQRRYEYIIPLKFVMPTTIVQAPDVPVVRKNKHRVDNLPKVSKHGLMDQSFPLDTTDGQVRVAFFRKLKTIFKHVCGKKRFHNFVTGGAAPSESTVSRRLDRLYHKELLSIRGEPWVVFSVSGDSILRGQIRKLLGLTTAIALGFLPEEYLDDVFSSSRVMEIPALPGWGLYLAECRYACYEAKYTDFRLDPRRMSGQDTTALDDWKEIVHYHIADIAKERGERSYQDFKQSCEKIMARYTVLQQYTSRTIQSLSESFFDKFGCDALVYDTSDEVDWREESKHNKRIDTDKDQKKEKNNEDVVVLEPGTEVTMTVVSPTDSTNSNTCTSRKGADDPQFMLNVSRLQFQFNKIPIERDDTPEVYREVLQLLRLADGSKFWPASSTGRQQVILTGSLLENGGRGGSFSVGALPRHLAQPRGNDLFPGKFKFCG